MGLTQLLSTALDGLKAQSFGLATTSDNVSNVNTPGYARRDVELETRGQGLSGVNVVGLRRISDTVIERRQYQATSLSSAASAANAIIDTVRSLTNDTAANDWHSVAVCSDGSYNVEQGLISSFPIRVRGGKWEIVQKVPINEFSCDKIDKSVAELKEEKSLVGKLLG